MFARDITFKDWGTAFPEQHNAYAPNGNLVGYVRVRNGWGLTYCPDSGSNEKVYESYIGGVGGYFNSNNERKKHLREIKKCIAQWCNEHPGIYGENDL